MSASPIPTEAMNGRLRTYLKDAGVVAGETAHSFRSGCAITLALSGSTLADVMSHVDLARSRTPSCYMLLGKVLRHESTSALLTEAVDHHNSTSDLTQLYHELNSLKPLCYSNWPFSPRELIERWNVAESLELHQ